MTDLSERLVSWLKAANKLAQEEEKVECDRGYFLYQDRQYVQELEKEFLKSLLNELERLKELNV